MLDAEYELYTLWNGILCTLGAVWSVSVTGGRGVIEVFNAQCVYTMP